MKKRKKILLIGPLPDPIHGMSMCNELIVKNIPGIDTIDTANKTFKEDLGKFGWQKIIAGIKPYVRAGKIFKSDVVYITPGQSFYGVLKNAPFIYLVKLLGKESIIHVHGNFLGRQYAELKGFKKKIFKNILQQFDRGIVLSESLKANLMPFLAEKNIYAVENFVEQFLLDINEKEIENKDIRKLKIVFLSNLMTEKGIFDLLDAMQILRQQKIDFEAQIAGNIDKRLKKDILKRIEELPEVTYKGVVRGEAKKDLLLQANTFVFPTYYQMEGQPLAVLEAMATGNIVLTTRHAGIPDVFSEKNGFYIQKQAPEDLAQKLMEVHRQLPELKEMMLENHRYAKARFSPQRFIDEIKTVLLKE